MAGSQVAWGLDIGTTALKAIKIRRDGDKVAVEAFDVIEHDKFLSEPDVDRDSIIRTSLQKFVDRNNPRRETMLMSVAGSKTFARFVKLPPVEPKKIPEIVKFEAIQQIPFPLEQVNWDYQTFSSADSPEVEVGIFAMKKDLVSAELSNFTAQKMTIHGVQLAPLALYNASMFDEWTEEKGTLLIDIGAEHTDLVIVDAGRIWLRTINLGGNHFTEALAKAFKQPFSRAESLKKSAATSKYQKQIFQAMRPIFADLVAEISRSLGHYQTSHRDSHLERIVAMGNPFKLPNLQKYIQQELKMEVIRLESFKKATVDTKLAAGLQENILSLGVAYGLALQGMDRAAIDTNLLPVNIAREMIWRQKKPWFAGAAAAILLACGYFGYATYAEAWDFEKTQGQQKANDDQIRGKIVADKQSFDRTSSTFLQNKEAVDRLMQLQEYRQVVAAMYNDIYTALPQRDNPISPRGYRDVNNFVAIKFIDSTYTTQLGTPIADYADDDQGRGVAGKGNGPGGSPMGPGGPGARPGAAPPPPAGGAAGAAAGTDRGFIFHVEGYTPAPGGDAFRVIGDYLKRVREIAEKDPRAGRATKKYYFTTTAYVYDRVLEGTAFGQLPWGWGAKAVGYPYWMLFVPKQMGLEEERPGAFGLGGAPGIGGPRMPPAPPFPIDAIIAGPGHKPSDASMIGYTYFRFKIKAHLR